MKYYLKFVWDGNYSKSDHDYGCSFSPSAPSCFYSSSIMGIIFFNTISLTFLYFCIWSTFYSFFPLNYKCQPSGELAIKSFQERTLSSNFINVSDQVSLKFTSTSSKILENNLGGGFGTIYFYD